MIRRSDNENWAVPGGAIDLGESMTQAAIRETKEESGIDCEITGLVGIYTDPKHIILYTSNGEARQEFSILLTGRPVGGTPTPSDESTEVRWVPTIRGDRLQHGPIHANANRALPGSASTPRAHLELTERYDAIARDWCAFRRQVVRATLATRSGSALCVKRVTTLAGPYRCLISDSRSCTDTKRPVGVVVMSQ